MTKLHGCHSSSFLSTIPSTDISVIGLNTFVDQPTLSFQNISPTHNMDNSTENFKHAIILKICYTALVYGRIQKKLKVDWSNETIEAYIKEMLLDDMNNEYVKIGKNFYITSHKRNVKLTINSYTNRIITADLIHDKRSKSNE